MEVLAADDMRGREAGTEGHRKAAAYVASRFAEIGLEPLGDGGTYLQNIAFLETRPVPGSEAFTLHRGDGDVALQTFQQPRHRSRVGVVMSRRLIGLEHCVDLFARHHGPQQEFIVRCHTGMRLAFVFERECRRLVQDGLCTRLREDSLLHVAVDFTRSAAETAERVTDDLVRDLRVTLAFDHVGASRDARND
ncbi:MAG TPA: hypothetical protein VMO24_01910 [Woeseiaceae bacterium]|nr:hypothetical protein [Woeseiaceae bacterium]